MTEMPQPMPGDTILGTTVIASTIYRDADPDQDYAPIPAEYTVLLLEKEAPYYTAAIVVPSGRGPEDPWEVAHFETTENIGEGLAHYGNAGGDTHDLHLTA